MTVHHIGRGDFTTCCDKTPFEISPPDVITTAEAEADCGKTTYEKCRRCQAQSARIYDGLCSYCRQGSPA